MGLIIFIFGIYGLTMITISFSFMFTDLSGILNILLPRILTYIEAIIILVIYIWTIQRCIAILKKTKEESKTTTTEKIELVKFFGFELDNTSGSIIFVRTLVMFVSILTTIFINFLYLTINYLSELLINLIYLIPPSLFLGIFIYPLICCLKFRKIHLRNKRNEITWFGFEMNITSASILFVMSILGLLSFLSMIFGFINNVIFGLGVIDIMANFIRSFIDFMFERTIEIILLVIYVYTLLKSVKLRKE